MRIPNNGVVLVADGRKSLFFRNEGDAEFPKLAVEDKNVRLSPDHVDQASDTAGGVSNTVGGHGGSMAEVDFHEQDEARFAADLAADLKARALANDFESLVIVAPPRTLGALRKHYHKEVADRVSAEIAKDLVNLPVDQIERILQDE